MGSGEACGLDFAACWSHASRVLWSTGQTAPGVSAPGWSGMAADIGDPLLGGGKVCALVDIRAIWWNWKLYLEILPRLLRRAGVGRWSSLYGHSGQDRAKVTVTWFRDTDLGRLPPRSALLQVQGSAGLLLIRLSDQGSDVRTYIQGFDLNQYSSSDAMLDTAQEIHT